MYLQLTSMTNHDHGFLNVISNRHIWLPTLALNGSGPARIVLWNTYIKLVQRRCGGVEKSQEGILGILVLDTYSHRANNTTMAKYMLLKHQRVT